ncbi:hypothetical protein IHE44_0011910 [Lamprotornis superbus]|uniref:Uncharacterized protein n=1 Tax=Lamprotornis superbus TaxID=245042 RepID=A0A835NVT1_9PASS|nr:hypothetical protein IHE44_0011910 [Lamprotornis superbus]
MVKKRRNWHRHDYTEPDDGSKPVQAGTRTFVKQLRARSFPSADEVILKMHGSQLTQRYLEKHGFDVPIMVPKLDGLGLRLPPPTFSVLDVERYVGGDKVIDVIDVARQADSKMKLHNYIKYFTNPDRPKVLNVISLEFSDTKMSELVEVPDIARKLSWGEKIFYLIKPTDENLALYESWSSSVTQSEVYFGDKVDKCYKCVVKQGHTLFVPTGFKIGNLVTEHAFEIPDNIRPGHLIKELSKVIRSVEDITSSKLNGRFNKPFQPSSTVPEWRTKDNDLRLLLSNGRIIRDERRPFTDRSLYTADSEDEDDRTRSKKTAVKVEDQPSGFEGEGNADAQKPLNMFFESVKSELRNGSSEYSDISDSEESEPDCTTQQKDSSTEESESSGRSVKEEEGDLGTSAWTRHLNEASRIAPQDANKTQKYIKKEGASEASLKVQENRSIVHSNSLSFQHGKYTRDSSLMHAECQLSDGSLSPDRPYGETSLSVPLHPTKRPASNPPPISNQATKGKRPKKGMATAKQRLGKILKLNRNGHARFFTSSSSSGLQLPVLAVLTAVAVQCLHRREVNPVFLTTRRSS